MDECVQFMGGVELGSGQKQAEIVSEVDDKPDEETGIY
jgi:hypothetical protein